MVFFIILAEIPRQFI